MMNGEAPNFVDAYAFAKQHPPPEIRGEKAQACERIDNMA
jgi:hypothetical protein